jgi:hypothetical protein
VKVALLATVHAQDTQALGERRVVRHAHARITEPPPIFWTIW